MNTHLRFRPIWVAIWIFGMLLGVYLSLRPVGAEMPSIPYADKFIHAISYAALAAFAVCLFSGIARWPALLWVLCLSGLIELAQGVLPTGRLMEGADMLANGFGVALGAAVFWRWNVLRYIERILT